MEDQCRHWREQLGAYVLGLLPAEDVASLQAHVAGCDRCRSELVAIAPIAAALRDVDPSTMGEAQQPPATLRDRVFDSFDRERRLQRRNDLARRLTAAAAAIALLGIGSLLRPPPAGPPTEAVALVVNDQAVTADAELINHTWGTEVILEATGLGAGEEYVLQFDTTDGSQVAGGTFIGVGAKPLTCRMNGALLRADAEGFTVTDDEGQTVIEGRLDPPETASAQS